MSRLYILIVGLALVLGAGKAYSAKVTFAEGEWGPYVSRDMPGYGFSSEIVTAALNAVGLEPDYLFYPWKRSLNMVADGEVMASFPWNITPEREKIFLYSDPIHSTREVFFYLAERFPEGVKFETLSDLTSYVVGGTLGYWYEREFDRAGLNLDYVAHTEYSFRKLVRGRVDLVPENEVVGWATIKNLFPGQEDRFRATEKEFNLAYMYVLFNKEKGELLKDRFNEGLKKIKSDGTYDGILKKYNLK